MKIAVDLMGSEKSPSLVFQSAIQALPRIEGAELLFLATPEVVAHLSEKAKAAGLRVSFLSCLEEITMSDDPLSSVRGKKNSTLVTGIKWLRRKKVDAFVSLGNTGALIAAATLFLPKMDNISRPALVVQIPTLGSPAAVLDVGGNVHLKASLLYQFALLGIHYSRFITGLDHPKVALLNIGVESKKGTLVHQEAFRLLKAHPDFIGNMESREVFSGKAQVVVTDGFAGNIFLKAVEGTAKYLLDLLQKKIPNLLGQTSQLSQFDYRRYPGALLLGVQGIIVKVHGEGSEDSILESVVKAYSFAHGNFLAACQSDFSPDR